MDQFQKIFFEEATDIINELEDSLLILAKNPTDKEVIERVFRAMHTLKGNGAMFGFPYLTKFTHHLETLFDKVRNSKIAVNKDLLDFTLSSVDHIKILLHQNENLNNIDKENDAKLIEQIQKWIQEENNNVIPALQETTITNNVVSTYFISFEPKNDILNNGTNPLLLLSELYDLGQCKVFPDSSRIPFFKELEPSKCFVSWQIVLSTEKDLNTIKDVFIFVEDDCNLEISQLANINLLSVDEFPLYLEEYYNKEGKINFEDLKLQVERLTQEKSSLNQPVSGKEEEFSAKKKNDTTPVNAVSTIRVNSKKLDHLMNLVSELITAQARLSLYSENSDQPTLTVIAEELEKISRQLRDNVFNICLVPLESVVIRFHRLVRELSTETGKEVDFITEGTDTELDKNSIELVVDPILHIIRNCIDHGIESKEERLENGKKPKGEIKLKAFYSGTNVCLHISDDGQGIDSEKVKKKAQEMGIIPKDNTHYTNKEIYDMLFLPGFSTSQKVTSLSGRGVGMDVVKRKIQELRGEVEVFSTPGVGTTIALNIPLTLSIIDGLLVEIETTKYVIPLSSIDKCYELEHEKLMNASNNLVFLGEEHIPFIHLRTYFAFTEAAPSREQMVVVEYNNNKVALVIDTVIGEYQAVLKPLGKALKQQDIVSGATILGDGTVALVLDPNKIISQIAHI
jgi:two-component system, chemotaxis family, sensor kinase CheA